jgi:hypothetical protein
MAEELAELRQRLQKLEDERAVQDLLVRYCLVADAESRPATSEERERIVELYADDCDVDIDNSLFMRGKAGVRDLPHAPQYDAICAHVLGPFLVEVDGSKATATGYGTVYVKNGDQVSIWRQGFGKWVLVKGDDGQWRIWRRLSRTAGEADARAIFAQAVS